MTEVSNNLLWFLQMLRNAEATLAMLLLNQKDLINTTEKSLTKLKRKL